MMKAFILASFIVVAASAILQERARQFQAFKLKHSKIYANQQEETQRINIFVENVAEIEAHNKLYEQGLVTYKKGVNKFADWTRDEFKAYLTLHKMPEKFANVSTYLKKGLQVPSSVDWRNKGYVTPVKNQGDCGSCWAFSVTGTVEGAYYKKTGKLVSLSEQQLVDCCTLDAGCSGGYLDETFPYIESAGLQSEASYQYTALDGTCKYDSSKVVTKVNKYYSIKGNEAALLEAVATEGPVSVGIDASYLPSYSSGIYSDSLCSPYGLNHGVLVVGYGSENGNDYWIIKNSWGTSWGEQGYFKLLRGVNECGVAEDNVYPVV